VDVDRLDGAAVSQHDDVVAMAQALGVGSAVDVVLDRPGDDGARDRHVALESCSTICPSWPLSLHEEKFAPVGIVGSSAAG